MMSIRSSVFLLAQSHAHVPHPTRSFQPVQLLSSQLAAAAVVQALSQYWLEQILQKPLNAATFRIPLGMLLIRSSVFLLAQSHAHVPHPTRSFQPVQLLTSQLAPPNPFEVSSRHPHSQKTVL